MADDMMRLMKSVWLDERAAVVAQEQGWTLLQARRYLQDKEIIERRMQADRRSIPRGYDRRKNNLQ